MEIARRHVYDEDTAEAINQLERLKEDPTVIHPRYRGSIPVKSLDKLEANRKKKSKAQRRARAKNRK